MANQYRSRLAGGAATGGDALPANVLSGKTFTNDNGPQTGTMTNRGAVSGTATPSTPYTIPEGYHNGQGVVTATSTGYVPVMISAANHTTWQNTNYYDGDFQVGDLVIAYSSYKPTLSMSEGGTLVDVSSEYNLGGNVTVARITETGTRVNLAMAQNVAVDALTQLRPA